MHQFRILHYLNLVLSNHIAALRWRNNFAHSVTSTWSCITEKIRHWKQYHRWLEMLRCTYSQWCYRKTTRRRNYIYIINNQQNQFGIRENSNTKSRDNVWAKRDWFHKNCGLIRTIYLVIAVSPKLVLRCKNIKKISYFLHQANTREKYTHNQWGQIDDMS